MTTSPFKEVHVLAETISQRRLTGTLALGAVAALTSSLALAAAALAAGNGASAPAVVKTHKTSLGTILADGRGRTLYLFMKDRRNKNKSACTGQCVAYWPPLTTSGKPHAGSGARASLLATFKRSDGRMQVSYNGHPLYRFAQDSKAGQTNGEAVSAFGAKWYAVSPAGAKVTKSSSSGGGYGGGYGR